MEDQALLGDAVAEAALEAFAKCMETLDVIWTLLPVSGKLFETQGTSVLSHWRAQADARQALDLRMQAASAMWAARIKEVPAPQMQEVRPPANA
jgi:hypothetical protein